MANNHMQRCPTYLPRKYRSIPECDTVHTQLGNRDRYQSAILCTHLGNNRSIPECDTVHTQLGNSDRYQSVTLLHTDYSSE